MKKSKEISYNEAIAEIEQIIKKIDNPDESGLDVDVLTENVKRALELIILCRNKLKSTDDEVKKLIENIDNTES